MTKYLVEVCSIQKGWHQICMEAEGKKELEMALFASDYSQWCNVRVQ